MNFNKTEQELKQMTEEEFFEYLDAKAQYLHQHTKKLSPRLVKNYAAISSAINNTEFDYESTKKIIEENNKF